MAFHDKTRKSEWSRLLNSFSYAWNGIKYSVIKERNLQIHLCLTLLVLLLGFIFSISVYEWIILILLIGGMLSLELMNTAIERVVDLVTLEEHRLAKIAKDTSAGAVFVFAIISVIIGLIIFFPYLTELL
ncbi:diacylglycerol kinase family protein [Bacillus timonensis]|nr:diacylglycerol kinase family protein [Bacillus timonensis]